MLYNFIYRDLNARYKGSIFGFFWVFINPLCQLIIYSTVFSFVFKVGISNFPLYVFVALIPWFFFTFSMQRASTCIYENKEIVKKIYFPRVIIPFSIVTAALINMIYSFIIILLYILVSPAHLSIYAILLPFIIIPNYLFVSAISIIISAVSVYFRDVEYIIGLVTMAWFYGTPIVYSLDIVPEHFRFLYSLNPMTHIIGYYRDILYFNKFPELSSIMISTAIFAIFFIVALFIFSNLQRKFAEVL